MRTCKAPDGQYLAVHTSKSDVRIDNMIEGNGQDVVANALISKIKQ